MHQLAETCIRRPIFASMIILAMVVVGAAAYFRLGVDRFPSVDLPTVSVRTTLPGASPEETETEVTQLIEEVVNTVSGIEEIRSISGPGQSVVSATFRLDRDIDDAAQDVRDRVAAVVRRLPDEADPPVVSKFDNDATPVLSLALSGPRPLRELTEIADKVVKVRLERSGGVGEVSITGGLARTINIWIDAHKLIAYQIPITAVRQALVDQNAEVPGGNLTGDRGEQSLRTLGRFADPLEFNELVVATINGSPVRIKDLGRAEDGSREQRSLARLNGQPSVSLEVRRQSGSNTIEVIRAVKANIERVRAELPPDVKLLVIRDQSRYIHAALHEINVHLVLGSALACLVVLAFMRNIRATFIAALAIPASVIATFGMMAALNFTLNSVTMLALVLMVGIVIDDAIVVLENVYRFIEEEGMPPAQAARQGTAEIALAVLATTLSLVVIFIPVSFMSSVSGRFLYQFGITAAVAVMVSLLVSFTLTPMLSARMLRASARPGTPGAPGTPGTPGTPGAPGAPGAPVPGAHGQGHDAARSRRGFYRYIDAGYHALLALAMRRRIVVALLAAAVIASSWPLYKVVRQDYLPSDIDEDEFTISITAPEGTSFAAMDQAMRAIEADLRKVPHVRTVLATVGGGFLGQVNVGNAYVGLASHEERYFSFGRLWKAALEGKPAQAWQNNRTQRQIMQEVRGRLRQYRQLRASVRNFPSFNTGGGNFDIDFVVRGPELEALADYTERLRAAALKIGGILDPDTTLKLNRPELRVQIDRQRAADLGVSARDIGAALRLMVGGDTQVSRFRDAALGEDYDVQLRLTNVDRDDPSDVAGLYLPRRGGGLVELSNLATLAPARSPDRIDRIDRQRAANLRGSIGPGYALADRIEALRKAADELQLPSAYSTRVAGRGRELERTFTEFLWAFALSIIFMYMILASNYESLVDPLTILISLPLSLPFALASLYATGGSLNLYSALGILVLFGVVKKNAILQIDHMNQLRARGLPRLQAILDANRDRLRPILMTTLALIGGMLPLAVGSGPGSEERRAVAIVVIGGQTLSLLLTLLVTPVVYSLLDDLATMLGWGKKAPAPAGPPPQGQGEPAKAQMTSTHA